MVSAYFTIPAESHPMSELGDFLERFYSPAEAFRTVRARVKHTKRSAPPSGQSLRRPIGRRRTDLTTEVEIDELLMWGAPPRRVRLEKTRTSEGRTAHSVEVVNGDNAWERHSNGVVEKQENRKFRGRDRHSLPTEYQRHFHRALLRECFAALTLEAVGQVSIAGRDCLKIRALQIPGTQLWPHWLSWEASEFEFDADVNRVVLLSIVGIVGGEAVESHVVEEVAFDEAIDESTFTLDVDGDEVVQPAIPVSEHITWAAAADRVGFTLLKPGYIPSRDRLQEEVLYHPARPNNRQEHVTIFYRGGDAFESLWITQQAQRDEKSHAKLDWSPLDVEGYGLEISDPAPEAEGLRILAFRAENTDVSITSDLPIKELIEIAVSMKPV
jgi:hypothetical protein